MIRPKIILFALLVSTTVAAAQSTTPAPSTSPAATPAAATDAVKHSQWNGHERIDFVVSGRPCILVMPTTAAPGRPWVWRSEFFNDFPYADIALLNLGWHLAYIDVQNMYGGPQAMSLFDDFYAYMTATHHLGPRPVLLGLSRGGLFAFNYAALHPERVGALYLDAPVLDIRSWPGSNHNSRDWKRALDIYGLTEETAASFHGNPLDKIDAVAKGGIPIIAVCGGADTTVPFVENTAILEKRYRELGGTIQVIVKPGGQHHPHSLVDPTPIVDFLLKNMLH